MMQNPIDHLSEQANLSDEIRRSLHNVTIERQFKRGDTIEINSEMSTHSYFIRNGSARAFYIRNGRERTYSFAFEGDVVATPFYLLKIPDAMLYIEFLELTDVIIIPRHDVKSILESHSVSSSIELATYFIFLFLDNARRLEERLLMFQLMNASERYHWFINKYPTITSRATLTQIASYLGITKETLYRIRSGKYLKK